MLARLANRRTRRWAAVLALLLNVGGGPMAWAHLAPGGGHCHTAPAPAAQASADCPEHRKAAAHPAAHPDHAPPCCDGGACACAAPPAPAAMSLVTPVALPIHSNAATASPHRVAPDPLDDSLRPPIR